MFKALLSWVWFPHTMPGFNCCWIATVYALVCCQVMAFKMSAMLLHHHKIIIKKEKSAYTLCTDDRGQSFTISYWTNKKRWTKRRLANRAELTESISD